MFIRKEIPPAVSVYSILDTPTPVPPVLNVTNHKYLNSKEERPVNRQIFPAESKEAFLKKKF